MNKSQRLVEAYNLFRVELENTPTQTEWMPFNWVTTKKNFVITEPLQFNEFRFRETAREHANDLANVVNELLECQRRLQVWAKLWETDADNSYEVFFEFIKPLAERSLLLPYTIQARFYFSVAHIAHQAYLIIEPDYRKDDLTNLPLDRQISQKICSDTLAGYRNKRKLLGAIEKINSGKFQNHTGNFRSIYTHRNWPGFEIGISKSIHRGVDRERTQYTFGGGNPLTLETAIKALREQCEATESAYGRFRKFVEILEDQVNKALKQAGIA